MNKCFWNVIFVLYVVKKIVFVYSNDVSTLLFLTAWIVFWPLDSQYTTKYKNLMEIEIKNNHCISQIYSHKFKLKENLNYCFNIFTTIHELVTTMI
jgi:hypothetical protein